MAGSKGHPYTCDRIGTSLYACLRSCCAVVVVGSPLDLVCTHTFQTGCVVFRGFTAIARDILGFLGYK